jgi:hypothetical protein
MWNGRYTVSILTAHMRPAQASPAPRDPATTGNYPLPSTIVPPAVSGLRPRQLTELLPHPLRTPHLGRIPEMPIGSLFILFQSPTPNICYLPLLRTSASPPCRHSFADHIATLVDRNYHITLSFPQIAFIMSLSTQPTKFGGSNFNE